MDSQSGAGGMTWRGRLYAVAFGLLAVAAVFAHRAAAPVFLLLAFAAPPPGAVYQELRGAFPPRKSSWYGLMILTAAAFALWTAVSAGWSPLPDKIDLSWRFGFAFAAGGFAVWCALRLSPEDKARGAAGLAWAVVAMAALLAFERLTDGALRDSVPPDQSAEKLRISLGRGALILVCLAWPAREILARRLGRPKLAWAVIAGAAIAATGFSIQVNAAGLIFGFAAYWLARYFPVTTLKSVFILMIATVWLAPFVTAFLPVETLQETFGRLPTSWLQRLHIWRYAGVEILSDPLWGGGVDYARHLATKAKYIEINGILLSPMPLHPHNLALHFWIDFGIVGAAILSTALIALRRGVFAANIDTGYYPMIAATLMSFFGTAMFDWSMWQVWRFALVVFAVIGCALAINGDRVRQGA